MGAEEGVFRAGSRGGRRGEKEGRKEEAVEAEGPAGWDDWVGRCRVRPGRGIFALWVPVVFPSAPAKPCRPALFYFYLFPCICTA